ncbi:serine/threonine-protein kinase [Pseudonocardia sp. TRM90224]|uniref:serine/threonine-protein kinase n=1 Tax=Pseudonocardia sp. TRM90224 TaxID=2812678 RepID=UPI001E364810|nr:serine/threonine-protein kinase [Pseudonocardia sp. TRM90224]
MSDEQFGPYLLQGLVGRGGMGEVFRAFDTVKQRTVAVKRLSSHVASDVEFQARFRRESEVAARLREAHVIPIHDYGDIDGRLYIDMRLVDGVDLDTVVAGAGAVSEERAVQIVAQVASALDAAHADGLVHRDVKPSNVLLTDDDFAYLVDFGIAAPVSGARLTVTGTALGTMAYMAPELFDGAHRRDKRVDVYSLACVLYKLLTGRRPFEADGLAAMMHAHVNVTPPPPSRVAAVSPAFDEVLARGMAKNPDERYQRAGDLADGARRALTIASLTVQMPHLFDRPNDPTAVIVAQPPAPSVPEPSAPPRQRWGANQLLIAGAVAVAVIVLAAGTGVAVTATSPGGAAAPPVASTSAAAPPVALAAGPYIDPKGRFSITAPAGWVPEPPSPDYDVFYSSPTPTIASDTDYYSADVAVTTAPTSLQLADEIAAARAAMLGALGARLTVDEPTTLADGTPAHLLGSIHQVAASTPTSTLPINMLQVVVVRDGLRVLATGTGSADTWHVEEATIRATLGTLTVGAR